MAVLRMFQRCHAMSSHGQYPTHTPTPLLAQRSTPQLCLTELYPDAKNASKALRAAH